jgi:STE24 endopeptidase
LETNEIVAVLAHEIGHYKLKHTMSSIILSILQTGIVFFILSLFIGNPDLSLALGGSGATFELGLIAFGILFSPISTAISLLMNIISRKNEYQADHFAAKYGQSDYLISALKRLSVKNLTNLTPHPAYVFTYYSHPSLHQRIEAILSKSNL